MNLYMIGLVKFESDCDDKAVLIAKKEMMKNGWRNLRLMKKYNNGWGLCKYILSFEK